MKTRAYLSRKASDTVVPTTSSQFQSRPFAAPEDMEALSASAATSARGFDPYKMELFAPGTGPAVQAKLTVGAPNDVYEQEADRVAAQVMSMPAAKPAVQREGLLEEDEELQAKPLGGSIQREALPEEEDEIQAKPLAATITPLVQREAMPEEEELQAKPLGDAIQREALPEDEEEPVQAKLIQREALPEEEEPIQAKLIQREALPEEEESVQAKLIQREALSEEEEEPIQAKSALPGGAAHSGFRPGLEDRLNGSKGGGSPLPDEVRSFMEPRFGTDFSGVRVHTGEESVQMSRAIGAQAFTHGNDVYFGAGKAPRKDALTAHELTHVVQQTGDLPRINLFPVILSHQSQQIDQDVKDRKDANQIDSTEIDPTEIPDRHILLEYVAHHIAYNPSALTVPDQSKILTQAGYDLNKSSWQTGDYGFQACLLLPKQGVTNPPKPILAIRGTASLSGISTDLDFRQVGDNQFLANQKKIEDLLNLAKQPVDITGHSLGGAVAQIIASYFPSQINSVVTFQSPGISTSTADKFEKTPKNNRPSVFHHISDHDFVDLAGDKHLPGATYEHDRSELQYSPLKGHTSFLFSTERFSERREKLGLDDQFMNNILSQEVRSESTDITRHNDYPYPTRQDLTEGLRSGASLLTSPLTVLHDILSSQNEKLPPVRLNPEAKEVEKRMTEKVQQYKDPTESGYSPADLFQERILLNPSITDDMLIEMASVPAGKIKSDSKDKVNRYLEKGNRKNSKSYGNIHKFTVNLFLIALDNANFQEISENAPDLGLTGTPGLFIYESKVTGARTGTALHDFTDYMQEAGVAGLNEAVWGLSRGDTSALWMMGREGGLLGLIEAFPQVLGGLGESLLDKIKTLDIF